VAATVGVNVDVGDGVKVAVVVGVVVAVGVKVSVVVAVKVAVGCVVASGVVSAVGVSAGEAGVSNTPAISVISSSDTKTMTAKALEDGLIFIIWHPQDVI
jgi:hypothetical protein